MSALIWRPLGRGRLTGKIRRGAPLPEVSRLHKTGNLGPQMPDEYLFKVVDALDEVAKLDKPSEVAANYPYWHQYQPLPAG